MVDFKLVILTTSLVAFSTVVKVTQEVPDTILLGSLAAAGIAGGVAVVKLMEGKQQ